MRQIKFRVFIKWLKIILEVESIDFIKKRVYCKTEIGKPNPCDFYSLDDIELMEHIGLEDKNNIEIYEGDVVKDSSGRLMIIEWDNRLGTARFILKTINRISHIQAGRYLDIHQWVTSDENDLEIIGNIYQNQEIIDIVEKHYFN